MPKPKRKIPRIIFRAANPISLTGEDWQTVEAAYGRIVSSKARAQIILKTNRFLQFAQAENTGAMNHAIERAIRLRKCAQSLIAAINDRAGGDVTREYVDDELALSHARLKGDERPAARKYVSEIFAKLSCFVDACDQAVKEINFSSQHEFWPAGGAWQVWIRQLIAIPTAATTRTTVVTPWHPIHSRTHRAG
jgi:hypothetical protein